MFSEARYYAAFKSIRNKFRKYRYYELIGGALEYINAPAKDKIESLKRHPWMVMFFVKWVLLDDQYPNTRGKEANNDDVLSILQSMYEMASKLRMPSEYDHYSLFLRNIAFQQFLYQVDFYYAHLSRQSILFSGLDKNHYIHKEFVKCTGIDVQDFLDLSLMTLFRFLESNEVTLPENWFSTVKTKYSTDKVNNFLATISKDIFEIRSSLVNGDNGKRPAVENYELTPFIEYPLIKEQGRYILTHRNILFRRLEYFVYDIMRSLDAEKFMGKFGELFERYVEKSIIHSEVVFLTEKKMKKLLGIGGNQIDFLIQEKSSNIFIDAKAVEMNSQGKTTHSSEILRNKTKNSILKAIKQSHDVIKKIKDSSEGEIESCPNNYLLVVTFKDLYLGNGENYYEVVAKEKMDEIYGEYSDYPCIPPENMYFITIDDLDVLTNVLKQKKITLTEILNITISNDKDPITKKFDFRQHLQELDITPQTSDYLAIEKDKMFERILEAAK